MSFTHHNHSSDSSLDDFLSIDPFARLKPIARDSRQVLRKPSFRRLPSVPRPVSRPLPTLPGALVCRSCLAAITHHSLACDVKKSFRGFSGKAMLFREIHNVILSAPSIQLMATGAHTTQQVSCICGEYLGFKIVGVKYQSEKWKESKYLLELECLGDTSEYTLPRWDPSSSDSDTSSDESRR